MIFLKPYNELPKSLQNSCVRSYYDILVCKKISLLLKRLFDLFFGLVLIILLSPIMLIIAIVIKIDSPGPVFFRQVRITTYGRAFKIFKFRTMVAVQKSDAALITTKNDKRITRPGHVLRKFRLDEFPQLINVIRGEMSFVGARPEVPKYVEAYTNEMKATLLLPAGITSAASIKFKDEDMIISKLVKSGCSIFDAYVKKVLPQKMVYNLAYIKDFSFLTDIKICFQTIKGVFLS